MNYKNHQALILCGGKGKRFQTVSEKIPKSLAKVSGKPILKWLIQDLHNFNIKKIILATGHLSEQIESFSRSLNFDLLVSKEDKPLGTGGAIKNAEKYLESENFLVLNGDSRIKFNLLDFYKFHHRNKAKMSILLSSVTKGKDFGTVKINNKNTITGFLEKKFSGNDTYLNSGVYFMNKSLLMDMKLNKFYSLEKELLPKWVKEEKIYGYVIDQPFIDIGTKERFMSAKFD